uniref:Uncharacterized protein n=1 Tax=Setaria italica TaxID=4555 RepID=K3ZPI5_SETIT
MDIVVCFKDNKCKLEGHIFHSCFFLSPTSHKPNFL